MKKNNITLVFVAIVFSIIVGMIIGKSLLKYKEGEPEINRVNLIDKEKGFSMQENPFSLSIKF